MKNREAKIGIVLNSGKVMIKSKINNLLPGDLALLITQIDMFLGDLKVLYKKGVKKEEG